MRKLESRKTMGRPGAACVMLLLSGCSSTPDPVFEGFEPDHVEPGGLLRVYGKDFLLVDAKVNYTTGQVVSTRKFRVLLRSAAERTGGQEIQGLRSLEGNTGVEGVVPKNLAEGEYWIIVENADGRTRSSKDFGRFLVVAQPVEAFDAGVDSGTTNRDAGHRDVGVLQDVGGDDVLTTGGSDAGVEGEEDGGAPDGEHGGLDGGDDGGHTDDSGDDAQAQDADDVGDGAGDGGGLGDDARVADANALGDGGDSSADAGADAGRPANVVVVDTINDVADGTTTSIAELMANPGADGRISLREAITAANATLNVSDPSGGGAEADRIHFALTGAAPYTIALLSPLPAIIDPVVLDGWSQSGWQIDPLIEIGCVGQGVNTGLEVKASGGGTTIRGLIVNRCMDAQVYLNGSSHNTLHGNWLGLNTTGQGLADPTWGPALSVKGSFNQIGGNTPEQRNVLAGHDSFDGHTYVVLSVDGTGGSTGNRIQGNSIGLDKTGRIRLGENDSWGISHWNAPVQTLIGGSGVGEGNVISGQNRAIAGNGIDLVIQGNRIGTDAEGNTAIPNNSGIYLTGVSGAQIGGTTTGARNIIGGTDSAAVRADDCTGVIIEGNWIGVGADGSTPLPNHYGVFSPSPSNGSRIGGTASGAGNLIANSVLGISLWSRASGWAIQRNTMHANSGLAIDLGGIDDGHTVNDGAKTVDRGNMSMDYPVFTTAMLQAGNRLSLSGYVGSAPEQVIFANAIVEVFKSSTTTALAGQGQVYLGTLTADSQGAFSGTIDVTRLGLRVGDAITGTATDEASNTSEFGPDLILESPSG